ncbi:MAG: hypothetical protein WB511_13880, partial [Nitrososphaeraceae archaeon]
LLTITSPPQERQNYSGVKKSNLDIVESTPFTYNMVISKVNLGFRIFPFQVGYNIFNISLTDYGSNKPLSYVSNVLAQLDKADSDLGPIIIRFTSKNTSRRMGRENHRTKNKCIRPKLPFFFVIE